MFSAEFMISLKLLEKCH